MSVSHPAGETAAETEHSLTEPQQTAAISALTACHTILPDRLVIVKLQFEAVTTRWGDSWVKRNAMPAFGDRLSEADIADVSAYIAQAEK